MKRRNFLSGLLAAPLALKARLAQCFGRKPVELCGAPIFGGLVLHRQPTRDELISQFFRQREAVQLLAEGKPMKEAEESFIRNPQGRSHPRSLTARQREVVQLLAEGNSIKEVSRYLSVSYVKVAPLTAGFHPAHSSETLLHCSLPRGHKGPHVLLNPR